MQQVSFVSWPARCACYSCDLSFTNVLLSVGLHNALVMKVIHWFGFNNHGMQLEAQEEIRRMRRVMVPRAQLMPYFDQPFIPQR